MRGLYDEEKQVQDFMFANKQHVDTRWVELFATHHKHVGRRVGFGRVAVNFEAMAENIWLQSSELCVCARARVGVRDEM